MNRYADPDPYGISEFDLAADPVYIEFVAAHNAPDDNHATCHQYNPFGMCSTCEQWYREGMQQGAEDFSNRVSYEDGSNFWRASHPQVPNVTGGAIEGYGHGWSRASLRSELRATALPYYELSY
jgi:hypothetical protein